MIDFVWHLLFSRFLDFAVQLHGILLVLVVGFVGFLLWLLMMHAMFDMEP